MEDLIETFYQVCYVEQAPLMTVFTPNTPFDMLVTGVPDSEGWVEWRLVPRNKSIDPALEALENEYEIQFPVSFKLWNSRYYTLDGDMSVVRLPASPTNVPTSRLRRLLSSGVPNWIIRSGIFPFGDEGMMDAGLLCFDTRQPCQNNEWPIVFWDHEWLGTSKEIGPVIFSSFEKLLECCIHLWSHVSCDDEEEWNKLVSSFTSIDPEGAGGPGRHYWETLTGTG